MAGSEAERLGGGLRSRVFEAVDVVVILKEECREWMGELVREAVGEVVVLLEALLEVLLEVEVEMRRTGEARVRVGAVVGRVCEG